MSESSETPTPPASPVSSSWWRWWCPATVTPVISTYWSSAVLCKKYFKWKGGEKIFPRRQFGACSSHIFEAWQCCSSHAHWSFGLSLDWLLLVSLGNRCLGDNCNNWSHSRVTKSLQRGGCEGNEKQRNIKLPLNLRYTAKTIKKYKASRLSSSTLSMIIWLLLSKDGARLASQSRHSDRKQWSSEYKIPFWELSERGKMHLKWPNLCLTAAFAVVLSEGVFGAVLNI